MGNMGRLYFEPDRNQIQMFCRVSLKIQGTNPTPCFRIALSFRLLSFQTKTNIRYQLIQSEADNQFRTFFHK